MLFNKLTIALVAGLAAVGEAEHHARRVHRVRSVVPSGSPALPTITRTVDPVPVESSSADATSASSSAVASSSAASSSVASSSAVSSGSASSSAAPSRTPSRTPSSIPVSHPPPFSTGVPSQGAGESTSDIVTVTYTVGSGTSTRVFTTTIHRTTTDVHTVTAVSSSLMTSDM